MDDVGFSAIFVEKNGSKIELMGYKGAIPKRSGGKDYCAGFFGFDFDEYTQQFCCGETYSNSTFAFFVPMVVI
ncbi:MAG: hypothetical protein WA130_09565 [Candidatus Methanoperedens sp.]